jgi:HK97 gp10 family phage protein
VKTELKLEGLEGVIDTLKSLPQELVSKRGGVVAKALRKAAIVIRDQEKANLQAHITANAGKSWHGVVGWNKPVGLLLQSIVVSRGKAPFEGNGERYLVRVRRRIYSRETIERVNTVQIAQLTEYGREGEPPYPFIRPAVAAKGAEAMRVFERELRASIDAIVARLERKNRRRKKAA